jgi:hypothetical protein
MTQRLGRKPVPSFCLVQTDVSILLRDQALRAAVREAEPAEAGHFWISPSKM